jgi:hypothetical protein
LRLRFHFLFKSHYEVGVLILSHQPPRATSGFAL